MNASLKREAVIAFVCIALSISFRSGAELCAKAAAIHGANGTLLNGWLLAVVLFSGLQVVTWTVAVRILPLSFAYPFMSLGIPLTIFSGGFIFHEEIRSGHYVGVCIVVLGVLAATWPARKSEVA